MTDADPLSVSAEAPWALVTGGGRGIGTAITKALSAAGYDLEISVLDDAEAATARSVLSPGRTAVVTRVDLTDRAATDRFVGEVRARRPALSGLCLNAGIGGPDAADDAQEMAHLDHLLCLNAEAPLRLVRSLADRLPRDGSGRIVVIASILGRMGVANFAAYCTSKSATIGLVRAMARDLAKHRITVNAICPGWTDTAMAEQGFEAIAAAAKTTPAAARAMVEKGLPLGRIVRPDEIAALVTFLFSPGAAMMTGQALLMDAGDLQR